MALKKSELYSSLWQSCDALRGGMDASQYKDYVLVLLFLKYISDKYAGQAFAPVEIPKGATFADMVALKGKPTIGDDINKKILGPLAKANKLLDMPDFADTAKLGSGKEMVDRITDLIAIFENPALDFSKNRAEGDDLLGDAYEYLLRHFAAESGKSKGQFLTPSEVSRVLAQVLGIRHAKVTAKTSVYDPTCGSGSLLLKIGDEARHGQDVAVTIYGQEKDSSTAGLARMNMILHGEPNALIEQGNTLASPHFTQGDSLMTFDYVAANIPFSDKRWSTGFDPARDPYKRFEGFGIPPAKQGDYGYLLHIVRSLKPTGKAACIFPHGVLFRGNAEATIRKNLIERGYIKGIIGLPPNLFYGTGIPACILVLDKEAAKDRKSIFMIDASKGFIKDGNKNRLREQDIHKIVDTFTRQQEIPKYSRLVPINEISDPKNDFNLNLPRYIDSQEEEDMQDIEGHLHGGIPERDVDALEGYWAVCPDLRKALFKANRPSYLDLAVDKSEIRKTIFQHKEFDAFTKDMAAHFAKWRKKTVATLKALPTGFRPKELIASLSEDLLKHYDGKPLIDHYDVYQHLMDYWAATMQDDCYLISADGWKAGPSRIFETTKKGKQVDRGWICELVPKELVVVRYFAKEREAIEKLKSELEAVSSHLAELEEEHGGEEGAFSELDKVNKANVAARLKEIKGDKEAKEEADILNQWAKLNAEESELKKQFKESEEALDRKAYQQYAKLSADDVKALVVEDKWMAAIESAIHGEMDRISQALTQRVKELAERYESPLPELSDHVSTFEGKVAEHLMKMGFKLS